MSKNKKNRPASAPAVPAAPGLSFASQTLAWTCLAWAVWILIKYWNQFPWISTIPPMPPLDAVPTQWNVFFLDLKALFLAVTSIAGMTAFGSYGLRLFRLPWRSTLEEAVFSMGTGMAATGYLLLVLGLSHAYRPAVFWGLWVAGLALAWRRWFRIGAMESLNNAAKTLNQWSADQPGWGFQRILLWAIVLWACVMAFVPEIFYDAMVYHLGVPRWFLHEGGISYYPSLHAQFPFLRQMLNVLGLALEGERLAKLFHASSAPLMIATYSVLANRYSSPRAALIAPLAFFSMPMVNMNLWTTGVDVGLASFALLGFLAWINGLTDPAARGRWFAVASLFAGFCFASKYPGVLVIAGFCITTLLWLGLSEKDWIGGVRESVRIGLIAFLVMLPWLLKTWTFTGNPLYPYLFNFFGGRDLLADRLLDFTTDTGTGAKRSLLPLLQTPWTATFTEISSFTSPGTFFLGFLGFLFAGLFRKELRQPWYAAGCFFFISYWLCINTMTDRMRLGIPGLAIGCFLLAHPASWFYERSGGFFRLILAGIVGFGALAGILSTLPVVYNSYVPWNVLRGRESAEAYLSYTHPGMDPYPSTRLFEYARSVIPPGKRLLIVGDEKTSPCPVPFLASGVHNDTLIAQWSREANTVEELAERFKQNRVSHVLINIREAVRLSPYKIFHWDDRSLQLYNAFSDKHLRLVHQEPLVERFFNDSSPLLLYQFFETPPSTAPSPNALFEMYKAQHAPHAS